MRGPPVVMNTASNGFGMVSMEVNTEKRLACNGWAFFSSGVIAGMIDEVKWSRETLRLRCGYLGESGVCLGREIRRLEKTWKERSAQGTGFLICNILNGRPSCRCIPVGH
jgi:hypothetical protein